MKAAAAILEFGPGDLASEGPLYGRIYAGIARKITAAEWRPGEKLPHETDLAERLGTSRMTVNRALNALVRDGLIQRKRKLGTVVAAPSDIAVPLTIRQVGEEIAEAGSAYGYRLIERRVEGSGAAAPGFGLDFGLGAHLVALVCLHLANGRPAVHERRWISLDAVPEAAAAPFERVPPGEWLMAHIPWSLAEHRIRALGADAPLAAALGLAEGTACLEIERSTWLEARMVTSVRLTYPGAAKTLVGRFRPAAGEP